ncbi:inositol monophosphatase [Salibacteraceae bacterium]|nr:inositol monophosphatase [Salibacteraceae bacterium]
MKASIDLDELFPKAEKIVRRVGKKIRKIHKSSESIKIDQKQFHDYVTEVDRQSEQELIRELGLLLPESGFLAEESATKHSRKGFYWVIDPLDGTTNFIHRLPVYAVSVALCYNEDYVMSFVFECHSKEMFTAYKGVAMLNGEKIRVSSVRTFDPALLATGFPFREFDMLDPYVQVLKQLMQKTSGLRRMGSAAVDLAYVACGRFDAYFEYNLNPWDVAAGLHIVRCAGGIVSDFHGSEEWSDGSQILASNPYLYKDLLMGLHEAFETK